MKVNHFHPFIVRILRAVLLALAAAARAQTSGTLQQLPAPDELLDSKRMQPQGQFYEAEVPATLDLAERARLSVHNLTSNVEPAKFYAVYQAYPFLENPDKPAGLTWNITVKNARTLPLMRVMCGSNENLEVEREMMKAL